MYEQERPFDYPGSPQGDVSYDDLYDDFEYWDSIPFGDALLWEQGQVDLDMAAGEGEWDE